MTIIIQESVTHIFFLDSCLFFCSSVCRYPMDVAFIVQNSMSENDFREVKSFMKDVMDALEVGRTNTYIGVITFNRDAIINLEFSSSEGK